jgi:DNA-binding PadR family transcriptional regulator
MDADTRHQHHGHHDRHEHQGWVRPGGRRGRWLEPFLLLLVAEDEAHGYSLIRQLNELGVAPGEVDVGMVYRTLRELEAEGLIDSTWAAETGAPRRDYRLTPEGALALAEWAAVMDERARLIAEFRPRYARFAEREGG